MTLKVALVGCGKIIDGHIEEIKKLSSLAKIVAVCDRELLMAEQVAVRYGLPNYYDDFSRLLEKEKPDVVHITTPPQAHLGIALQALEAGCHVYVEKPLTLNHLDSEQLVSTAIKKNRKLTIGYTYLFDPPAVQLRKLYADGLLGEIIHIDSAFGYNLSGPFGKALLGDSGHWVHRLPGKLFQNNIDHLLYKTVEFFKDDESPSVSAFASTLRAQRFGDIRDEMQDELRITLQGDRMSVSGVFSSHIRPVNHFIRVYGTKNTAHVDFLSRTLILETVPTLPSAIGRLIPPLLQSKQYLNQGIKNINRFKKSDFHFFAGLSMLISSFYSSILNETEVPISYKDILLVSSIMDDIFLQIQRSRINP